MTKQPVIYWFRNDLRLADSQGLAKAASAGLPVLPVYVLDDEAPGEWTPGAASRWWLRHSLKSLAASIRERGGRLAFRVGPAARQLIELASEANASAIYCSRAYEPWATRQEQEVQRQAADAGLAFERFPGSLLFEPQQIRAQSGRFYQTFTPFWKACRRQPDINPPQRVRRQLDWHPTSGLALEDLRLTAKPPASAAGWHDLWQPGEAGAANALRQFLDRRLANYQQGRDIPGEAGTSRLSPHLHFGEISARQMWCAVKTHALGDPNLAVHQERFLSQIGWREFSQHLLHHVPELPNAPFNGDYRHFPWTEDPALFEAWRDGRTGYPLVDAGMRELSQTGYMHNRVRMVVASFLTKHLLQPWQAGERWFWEALVDADLANNAASWQWVAGSGADAAPYFRIFNPALQGQRFDPDGRYVRRWLPELSALPNRHLHSPADAPDAALKAAGVVLDDTYPRPIVDHRQAREAALAAHREMREATAQDNSSSPFSKV